MDQRWILRDGFYRWRAATISGSNRSRSYARESSTKVSTFPATAPTVSILIEILAGPPVATKAAIIELLAAMTSAHDDDIVEGYNPFAFRSQHGPPDYPEATAE
ncbi:MAG: hypothetical protein V2A73_00110 [Pseudomonadota bacterium]